MLHNDYKYYLAFENTWCPDYVTEKFYRSLKYNTFPIVMGGAEYERFAPPNSYINIKDFRSPKELAEYILMLYNSDELYAKYFNSKKCYSIAMP
jgi:alpha-1,3-fucosyltransferase